MTTSHEVAIKILAKYDQARKAFDEMGKSTTSFSQKAKAAFATIKQNWLAIAAAVATVTATLKKAVGTYLVQEKAENDLAAAMRNTGLYTRQAHDELLKFASARQAVTTYGDEQTLSNMALLQTFQMTTEELKKATIASQDFASGLGIDLRTAALLVGKAFAGDTATLSRYGIKIREGLEGTQKFDEVMKQINIRFGGRAQADLETYGGRLKNIMNLIGDKVWEKSGEVILKSLTGEYNPFAWLLGTYEKQAEAVEASKSAVEKLAKYRKEQEAQIKKEAELVGKSRNALAEYAKQIDSLGEKYLVIGKLGLDEQLSAENASIDDLRTSTERYKAIIEETYNTRRNMHLAIITDMVNQKAKEEEILAARAASLKSQIAMNEELLASYRSYYGALTAMRDKSMAEYKMQLQSLAEFEKETLSTQKEIVDIINREFAALTGETPAKDDIDKFQELDTLYAQALEQSGEDRLAALESYIRLVSDAAESSEAIRTGISSSESVSIFTETALERLQAAQTAWEETRQSIADNMAIAAEKSKESLRSIDAEIEFARNKINFFANEIVALQTDLENLQASILISVDDQATMAIDAIRTNLETLHDKTVRVNVITSGLGDGGEIPSYATGTPYVPQTGLALVHKGERITPANQNTTNNNQAFTVNYYGNGGSGSRVKDELSMRRIFNGMQAGISY